jgi:hypothetical protein
MKDTEIHNGLSDAYIRDFFSDAIGQCFSELTKIAKEKNEASSQVYKDTRGKHVLDYTIESHKVNIKYDSLSLAVVEKNKALCILAEDKGWKEWDASDLIRESGDHFRNFIGTEDEFRELIISLDQDPEDFI